MKCIQLLALILGVVAQGVAQQTPTDIYPSVPFDMEKIVEQGIGRIGVWKEVRAFQEGDLRSVPWSTEVQANHQSEQYEVSSYGLILKKELWAPGQVVLQALDYFYKEDTWLSAIDEYQADEVGKLRKTSIYAYTYNTKGLVAEKAQFLSGNASGERLVFNYQYDEYGRLTREKQTWLQSGNKTKTLILWEYHDDDGVEIRRTYENLYQLTSTEKYFYDEEGRPMYYELFNAEDEREVLRIYEYVDGRLAQEREYHNLASTPTAETSVDLVTHYSYDEVGLLVRKIVELGTQQQVFYYGYYTE